jgi:hypothetical protein
VNTFECPFESAVIDAIVNDRWPHACDDATRQHAAGCASCRELTELLTLMRDDDAQLRQRAGVPSAGQVWWRAAIRARLEATHTAARPLSWLFGTVGACALGLAVALLAVVWPPLFEMVVAASEHARAAGVDLATTFPESGAVRASALIALGAATFLLLMPLVLYLALSDD